MSKMTIEKAAEFFGVSKEAIHNRVRRGSLKSVIQNGVKFVIVEKKQPQKRTQTSRAKKTDTPFADEKYYKFLQEQNSKLQNRVEVLEKETRTLRDQKEQMLIDERKKIEQIYRDKDEQLKSILNAISSKFMLAAPIEEEQEEHLDAEIELKEEPQSSVISLKKYLKQLKLNDKKIQKIKKRFKKKAKKDDRVIIIGKKYYIDISKYDYSDLLY
jgi:hypothetical protein